MQSFTAYSVGIDQIRAFVTIIWDETDTRGGGEKFVLLDNINKKDELIAILNLYDPSQFFFN